MRNAQKWAMRSLNNFDLLILRDCVLRFGNVHIGVVLPFFVVDLLILVNRVQALKRSNIGSAVL